VADLGIDRIMVYAVDADSGMLSRHADVAARAGAGPRHMAIHPDGRHLFVINELDLTVAVYDCDPSAGNLTLRQVTPVADAATPEESLGADLHMTSVGDRLVVSVRGPDVLVSVAFDPQRGFGDVAEAGTGGSWPRGFCLLDDGRSAVVANRRSDEVSLVSVPGGSHPDGVVARHRVPEPSCAVPWSAGRIDESGTLPTAT
jgi:6-phosphogluconolactonase